MKAIQLYIMVDDDAINNMLCTISLKRYLGDNIQVKSFTEPELGLGFIKNEFNDIMQRAVLLLDVNMPTMTGWEFMEEFDNLSEEVQKLISVYILSSSIDEQDKQRADSNKNIIGFISKPLTQEILISISNNQHISQKDQHFFS
ncbi:MAG: response regulator [Parafilimonas sp.]